MTSNAGILMPLGLPASYEAYLRKQYEEAYRRTYEPPKERNKPNGSRPKPQLPDVPTPPRIIGWKRIAFEVCAKHGIQLREMTGSSRVQRLCKARREAWWRCRNELSPKPSSGQLGMWFKRDHSTILYGLQCWRDAHPNV